MDFARDVTRLLSQIPVGRVARIAAVARALGDVRASAAVAAFLASHPEILGADRVVTADVRVPVSMGFHDFIGSAPLARLRREQRRVAAQVSDSDGFRELRTITGVDVAYEGEHAFAAAVSLDARSLEVVEVRSARRPAPFPYIPSYLAYREAPLAVSAVRRLRRRPTVLLVDGHGRLHPQRCGLACLVGVRLALPTIGVAKNPLIGEVQPEKAGIADILVDGVQLGCAVRTGRSARPVFVSTGHRVSLRTAVEVVRGVSSSRIPEPIRHAHLEAEKQKGSKRKKGSRRFDPALPRSRDP